MASERRKALQKSSERSAELQRKHSVGSVVSEGQREGSTVRQEKHCYHGIANSIQAWERCACALRALCRSGITPLSMTLC